MSWGLEAQVKELRAENAKLRASLKLILWDHQATEYGSVPCGCRICKQAVETLDKPQKL